MTFKRNRVFFPNATASLFSNNVNSSKVSYGLDLLARLEIIQFFQKQNDCFTSESQLLN